eukprot:scaffold3236_cov66-Cylindrotheca_fusiformis.AAC.7
MLCIGCAFLFLDVTELPGTPEIPVHGDLDDQGTQGVVGLTVPRYNSTVALHSGARKVLHELATNPIYKGVQLATASSSLEPSYSYACLDGIEILPGLVMADMMRCVIDITAEFRLAPVTQNSQLFLVHYIKLIAIGEIIVRELQNSLAFSVNGRRKVFNGRSLSKLWQSSVPRKSRRVDEKEAGTKSLLYSAVITALWEWSQIETPDISA